MLTRHVHIAVDQRHQVVAIRTNRIAKIDHGDVIAVVLLRDSSAVAREVALSVQNQEAHAASAGEFDVGIQKKCGLADTGRADHEAMHIVTVHQRLQPFAALHTAENQSLHSWSLLPSAPRCNIKGYRDVGFSDLLIRCPACCAILPVANGFGFDIVQRVIVR